MYRLTIWFLAIVLGLATVGVWAGEEGRRNTRDLFAAATGYFLYKGDTEKAALSGIGTAIAQHRLNKAIDERHRYESYTQGYEDATRGYTSQPERTYRRDRDVVYVRSSYQPIYPPRYVFSYSSVETYYQPSYRPYSDYPIDCNYRREVCHDYSREDREYRFCSHYSRSDYYYTRVKERWSSYDPDYLEVRERYCQRGTRDCGNGWRAYRYNSLPSDYHGRSRPVDYIADRAKSRVLDRPDR